MKKLIILFFVLLSLVLSGVSFAGTTRYVSPSGSDSNTGLSHAQAWQTIDKARSYSSYGTGDDIYFECGYTYTPSGSWNISWSGGSSDRGVIGAYYVSGGSEIIGVSGNRPIISGSNYTIPTNSYYGSYDSYLGLIHIVTKDYITIENIHILNSGFDGIRVNGNLDTSANAQSFVIDNVRVQGSYNSGIVISANPSNYGLITDCEVSGAGYGYHIGGESDWPVSVVVAQSPYSNTTITKCYVHENYGEGIGSIRVPSSVVTNNSGYVTITDNIVWNNRRVMIYVDCTTNNSIRRNVLLGGGTSVVGSFASYYPGGGRSQGYNQWGIWVNREYRSDYGGTISISNNEIALNLIAGVGVGMGFATEVSGESYSNIKFLRNTLLSNYTQISIGSQLNNNTLTGCEIKGNIIGRFSDDLGGYAPSSPQTWWDTKIGWSYNIWPNQPSYIWDSGTDGLFDGNIVKTSGWQLLTGTISANNAYLLSDSNAIDTGVIISGISTDFEGTSIPQGDYADKGFQEYITNGGGSSATPSQYMFDPNEYTLSTDPINLGDFYSRKRLQTGVTSVESPQTTTIVSLTTPFGSKAWQLTSSSIVANYLINLVDVDQQHVDVETLILYKVSVVQHAQLLPAVRLDNDGNIEGYTGGIVSSTSSHIKRFNNSVQSTLNSNSHGFTTIEDTWYWAKVNATSTSIKKKEWAYGTAEPSTWTEITDTNITSGGGGFQAWFDTSLATNPTVYIAWIGIGGDMDAPVPSGDTTVYFSVSPYGTGDIKTGSPTISISNGVATLSTTQTNNIGRGCVITYNTSYKVYITYVSSGSSFIVRDVDGDIPADVSGATVNSINYEFATTSAALTGIVDSNHLNTTDFVTNKYIVYLVKYKDRDDGTADSPVTFSGITTSSSYPIINYVANGGSWSIMNDRHNGTHGSGYIVTSNNAGNVITVSIPYAKFIGEEWYLVNNTASNTRALLIGNSTTHVIVDSVLAGFDTPRASQQVLRPYISSGDHTITLTVENSILYSGGQACINPSSYSGGVGSITINVNSSLLWGCGNQSSGGGIRGYQGNSDTLNLNVYNSALGDNYLDFQNASGTMTWDIHNTIDHDGTSSLDSGCSGCYPNYTFTDNTNPGEGNYVILNNITTPPYNLMPAEDNDNDILNKHAVSSGAGMAIPLTDILGVVRPVNTNYCVGPREWLLDEDPGDPYYLYRRLHL